MSTSFFFFFGSLLFGRKSVEYFNVESDLMSTYLESTADLTYPTRLTLTNHEKNYVYRNVACATQ